MSTKTKTKIDVVAKELRQIYKRNGNRIYPPDVVEAARSPDSPLHKHFTWDDTKAAQEFRLIQARQLIATVRIIIPSTNGTTNTVRAYHALRSDENGYRRTDDIIRTPELLNSLVAQLSNDLERVTERYNAIRHLEQTQHLFQVIEEFCKK